MKNNSFKTIRALFDRVFTPKTTFEQIQNLQDEDRLSSAVDSYLQEQVAKLNKGKKKTNEQKSSESKTVLLEASRKEKRLGEEAFGCE